MVDGAGGWWMVDAGWCMAHCVVGRRSRSRIHSRYRCLSPSFAFALSRPPLPELPQNPWRPVASARAGARGHRGGRGREDNSASLKAHSTSDRTHSMSARVASHGPNSPTTCQGVRGFRPSWPHKDRPKADPQSALPGVGSPLELGALVLSSRAATLPVLGRRGLRLPYAWLARNSPWWLVHLSAVAGPLSGLCPVGSPPHPLPGNTTSAQTHCLQPSTPKPSYPGTPLGWRRPKGIVIELDIDSRLASARPTPPGGHRDRPKADRTIVIDFGSITTISQESHLR